MSATLRPVSGLERVWLTAGRLAPPFAIHLVVEAAAPLEVDRWRAAIERAGAVWPGLRARLAGRLRGCRWVAVDDPVPVEVIDGPWGGQGPAGWLDAPLLPGAPARARLLPAEGRAVFSAHHAVTDGRGLFGFVHDVVEALGGRSPAGAAGGPLWDAALARELGVSAAAAPKADAAPPFDGAPGSAEGITWVRRRLPPGPAVVPRVVAAVVAAAGRGLRVGVPVDLRRHRPGLRSSANLTGVVHLDVPTPDPAAVRAALDRAVSAREAAGHARAAEGVRGLPVWMLAAIARRLTLRARRAGRLAVSATVSSLGAHRLALDGRPLRVLFVPPGAPGLPLFVGLCGDAGGVELAAVSPRAWAEGGRLDGALDRLAAAYGEGP